MKQEELDSFRKEQKRMEHGKMFLIAENNEIRSFRLYVYAAFGTAFLRSKKEQELRNGNSFVIRHVGPISKSFVMFSPLVTA
jgi:hypothetical protein